MATQLEHASALRALGLRCSERVAGFVEVFEDGAGPGPHEVRVAKLLRASRRGEVEQLERASSVRLLRDEGIEQCAGAGEVVSRVSAVPLDDAHGALRILPNANR